MYVYMYIYISIIYRYMYIHIYMHIHYVLYIIYIYASNCSIICYTREWSVWRMAWWLWPHQMAAQSRPGRCCDKSWVSTGKLWMVFSGTVLEHHCLVSFTRLFGPGSWNLPEALLSPSSARLSHYLLHVYTRDHSSIEHLAHFLSLHAKGNHATFITIITLPLSGSAAIRWVSLVSFDQKLPQF